MQHGREQLHMQRGVPEALLEPVAAVVPALRVHFRVAQLVFGGDVIPESFVELAIEEDFEYEDDKDRRERGYPEEGPEAARALETDGCNVE